MQDDLESWSQMDTDTDIIGTEQWSQMETLSILVKTILARTLQLSIFTDFVNIELSLSSIYSMVLSLYYPEANSAKVTSSTS